MKFKQTVLLGAAMAGLLASSAASAAEEQFIGLPSYRVGPYAAGGVGIFGGWIGEMPNERGLGHDAHERVDIPLGESGDRPGNRSGQPDR